MNKKQKDFIWGIRLAWKIDRCMLLFWGLISLILAVFPALILACYRQVLAVLSQFLTGGQGQIGDVTGALLVLGILITVSGLSARLNRDFLYMTMYDSFYLGLEETMMEAAQRIDLAELVKKEVSDEYFGAISRCGALTDITSAGCILMGSVVSIVSILVVAFSVSPRIVVAALAYVAFVLAVNMKIADKVRVVFKEVREHWRKATYIKNLVKEGDTAKETRIYSSVDKLKQEWAEARGKADAIVLRGERGQVMIRILCQIGLYGFLALVMATGLVRLGRGEMNPETLLMLFTLGVSISEAVAKISECYQQLNYGIYGLGLQRDFLEKTPAVTEEEEALKKDTPLEEQICFRAEHMDFSYGDGEKVLNDLSFTISKGETVAIVGANGSGKTTLLKLLMGLYRPDSGILTFQGRNYEEYKQGYLSQKIGAFFQDFILFHLTVKENVGLGNIDYMDEEEMIWDALRKGGAATMVFSWKKKLEERLLRYVYRDGLMLSGGESQRLAVSRTHMSDKEILIFDEPASMLDPIAELEQFRHIKEKLSGHTALLVSHRIGFARLADRILVLDQGRIAESGTHEELMAEAGLYAKLFQEQAQWYQVSGGTV